MAQRGRKPEPTPLKLLEGNPGKRPLPQGEVRLALKAPRCHSGLKMMQRRSGKGWEKFSNKWEF